MHEIELKSSRMLGLLLLGMGGLSLVAISLSALPGAVRFSLGAGLIVLLGWNWRRVRRTESLRIAPDGRLQSQDAGQGWRDVEVLGDSVVSPGLTVVRYRFSGAGVRTLVLLPDSAPAEDLRRLRVSLRWAGRTRSDTGFPGVG